MESEKKYRPNVAAIILSPLYPLECKIFIAQRSDIKGAWQFPQGGIDKGEEPREALLRELGEEIGTSDVEILGEYPEWISYDFPPNVAQKRGFDGQRQRYFLVRLSWGAKINLHTTEPEFDEYRFVSEENVLENINHFKKGVYHKVLKYFKQEGYL